MKLFLSHSSKDKDLVTAVHNKLGETLTWFDAVDIENGNNIPEKINNGLLLSSHFVLFWSINAKQSNWVNAEITTAFMEMMSDNCKFIIFALDDTPLPPLLRPYKREDIDVSNLENASSKISNSIQSNIASVVRMKSFVNRHKELEMIEHYIRNESKIVFLHGILGIGKSSLAKKAILWIYNDASQITIDFQKTPGMPELALEFCRVLNIPPRNENKTAKEQKENIKFSLELIAEKGYFLIMKDVKSWLTDKGEPNDSLDFLLKIILETKIFKLPVIATSSRYPHLPVKYREDCPAIKVDSMSDDFISEIIKNNLPKAFDYNRDKNKEFARKLYGYPLGAKIGAHNIVSFGYDYYLNQPIKFKELNISLAKDLIFHSNISEECSDYLKINVLAKSKLYNTEYAEIFNNFASGKIAELSDEAVNAGLLKFEDSCYKLEPLVVDYYYDLAFNDTRRKDITEKLEKYLLQKMNENKENFSNYFRLLPIAIHILVLNGKFAEAHNMRSEMFASFVQSMWDQYNHRGYEDALKTANQLISLDDKNIEARYVKVLCLIRFGKYDEAREMTNIMINEDDGNPRYYYALGRIEKAKEHFEKAIIFFNRAISKDHKHLSSYREIAECYFYSNDIAGAKQMLSSAKSIDSSNAFLILLESKILQKEGKFQEALNLINNDYLLIKDPAQIYFRRGRIYDDMGEWKKAVDLYESALSSNPKMYDAKLCLLSHQATSRQNCKKDIEELKNKLTGKRKYILMNIEARHIGYFEQNESKALFVLESVDKTHIDKQWYAVKIQLLEKIITRFQGEEKLLLAEEHQRILDKTKQLFKDIYGEEIQDRDLLPNT